MSSNYWKAMQKQASYENRWLKVNPNLPKETGIYFLTRTDENGLLHAYIGQTQTKGGILTRLAQHSMGFKQHIDLSLKKHGLYNEVKNPYGWKADYIVCLESELDMLEQKYILEYASKGYQLKNSTTGSQGIGKAGINDLQTTKGYRDGIDYGYKKAFKEIKEYFDKYLVVLPRNNDKKKNGEIKEIYLRKLEEFKELIK